MVQQSVTNVKMKKITFFLLFVLLFSVIGVNAFTATSSSYNTTIKMDVIGANITSENSSLIISGGSQPVAQASSGSYNLRLGMLTYNDTTAPKINSALVNLTLASLTNGATNITWTEDNNSDAKKYNIYRSTFTINAAVNNALLIKANTSNTSFVDLSPEKAISTTYFYVMTALDSVGNENKSAFTTVINITTPASCTNSFTCGGYSTCSSNSQSRTCTRTCYLTGGSGNATLDSISESQSCVSSSSSSGGSSSGTPVVSDTASVSKTFSTVDVDEGATFEVDNSKIDVFEVKLEVNNEIQNVKLSVKSLASKPSGSDAKLKDEEVYSYVEITKSSHVTNDDIKKAVIKFKVEKEWLVDNDFKKSQVRMYRFVSSWEELITKVVDEDSDFVFFEAESEGFSYFKISVVEFVEEPVEEVQEESTTVDEPVKEVQEEQSEEGINTTKTDGNQTGVVDKKEKSKLGLILLVIAIVGLLILIISKFMNGGNEGSDRVKNHYSNHSEKINDKESMDKDRVVEYHHKKKSGGFSDDHIVKSLVKAGWDKTHVENIIKHHGKK